MNQTIFIFNVLTNFLEFVTKLLLKKVISLKEKFIFKEAEQKCKTQTRCYYIGQVLWLVYIPSGLKVKFTLVQVLRPCGGRTVHRESRGIALLFLDHGTRRGWGGQRHAPAALHPEKVPVPILQEAGWAPGPVWTGAENLAPTGIRSPDLPACSQSLYQLSYPAHTIRFNIQKFYVPSTQCICSVWIS